MLLNEDSISKNVLGKIVAKKKLWLEKRMEVEPLDSFKDQLKPSDRSLASALTTYSTNLILECKKASPSKGLIRPNFDVKEIAKIYNDYAQAVSVLAEEDFFQGNVKFISEAREVFDGPVICKDFIIDPYQIYLARRYNADSILLMLSVLPDESYRELAEIAQSLNLDVLTEASNEEEIARAIKLNAKIIGINNRNLRDLTVDLSRTEKLAHLIPEDRIKVCESGIYTHKDLLRLAPHVNAFLVGSSLTSQENISLACRKLIYGNVKICGITKHEEAEAIAQNGGTGAGLIFVPKTPRCVTIDQAEKIKEGINLDFIGVFLNAPNKAIIPIANRLKLFAIQLHGHEDLEQIKELRTFLPHTKIWKAISVTNDLNETIKLIKHYIGSVDKILLDAKIGNKLGGTGVTFDWSCIDQIIDALAEFLIETNHVNEPNTQEEKDQLLDKFKQKARSSLILAGGLNLENAKEAEAQGLFALDFNSGLESSPANKDLNKIKELFNKLRNF